MTQTETQAQHSPLPWRLNRLGGDEHPYVTLKSGQFDVVSGRYSGMGIAQDMADAEFIVRACNSFDDLLAACEMAQDGLAYHYGPNGDYHNATMNQPRCGFCETYASVEAAIAKARGGVASA